VSDGGDLRSGVSPEHWRFSSAKYWLHGGTLDNDVLLSRLEW